MGLFENKVEFTCPICGNTAKAKQSLFERYNGVIPCERCKDEASDIVFYHSNFLDSIFDTLKCNNVEKIKSILESERKMRKKAESFEATSIGSKLQIDVNNKLLRRVVKESKKNPVDAFFDFSMIKGYEIIENGASVTKGGLGSAVAGGLLFGGVGAIVGGVTGRKKTKNTCTNLDLCIYIDNPFYPMLKILYLTSETKKGSFTYNFSKGELEKDVAIIKCVCDINEQTENQPTNQQSTSSVADEIKKFKELLDMGAITQEEFDAKKKQLLGL